MVGGKAPSGEAAGVRRAASSVLWILLGIFTATMCGLPDNSDAECEFQTTSALARGGTLALGGTPEGDAMVALNTITPVRQGVDGRWYSWFGVGQAGLGLPFYGAGRVLARVFPGVEDRHGTTTHYGIPRSEYFAHLLVGWRNPLLSALTAAILVRVVAGLGAARWAAWLAGLSYGLTTFAWAQARSTLSDVQATFFLCAAFALLLSVRRRVRSGAEPRAVDLALLGLCLGMAFLTRVLAAPAVAVLLAGAASQVPAVLRQHGSGAVLRAAAWLGVPAAAGLAIFLWVNQLRFGDPLESGYGAPLEGGSFFGYPLSLGLSGLLVAPGKGLLWLAPLVLLAPLGFARAWRQGEHLPVWVGLGVAAAWFLPVAKTATWHGAWTYGPRYVLPALPFLWCAVGLALEPMARRTLGRGLLFALGALGLVTNLPASLVDHIAHQDLALAAVRLERAEDMPEITDPGERDARLFQHIQWEWRYAAPWAHWRIFFHRIGGRGEAFSAADLFFLDGIDAQLSPSHDRDRGFAHLAWVDLARRLGGSPWPGLAAALAFLALGVRSAFPLLRRSA